jgi:hypothetical protein
MDTLAVRLAVPLPGAASDFNRQESAPCQAYQTKRGTFTVPRAVTQSKRTARIAERRRFVTWEIGQEIR